MCAHQHPIQARPGRDYNPPESTCYVTSAVDEAVLIQIWFKRAWFKSASLCYLTGHLLRLGTVINIWIRHHLFAWFHMFRCIYIERWMRYWLCGTQNGSITYAHFIDGIPEIPIPTPYEGKVEDTVNFVTDNCFSCTNEIGWAQQYPDSFISFPLMMWTWAPEQQGITESTQTDSRVAPGFSLEFCSGQLYCSHGPSGNVNQLKIKPVCYSIKHLFPFSSIPVLVLTVRHTPSLFCLFSFRVWLHKQRYNSNQYFQAKRSLLHMDIMVIRYISHWSCLQCLLLFLFHHWYFNVM